MPTKKPKKPANPEPLQPGDAEIAAEEIEGYFQRQTEQARAELEAAQARFDQVKAKADAAITAFRAGERLGEIDAWSIELHAGGHMEAGQDLLMGRTSDRTAYEQAMSRRAATRRWLRHEGYEPIR